MYARCKSRQRRGGQTQAMLRGQVLRRWRPHPLRHRACVLSHAHGSSRRRAVHHTVPRCYRVRWPLAVSQVAACRDRNREVLKLLPWGHRWQAVLEFVGSGSTFGRSYRAAESLEMHGRAASNIGAPPGVGPRHCRGESRALPGGEGDSSPPSRVGLCPRLSGRRPRAAPPSGVWARCLARLWASGHGVGSLASVRGWREGAVRGAVRGDEDKTSTAGRATEDRGRRSAPSSAEAAFEDRWLGPDPGSLKQKQGDRRRFLGSSRSRSGVTPTLGVGARCWLRCAVLQKG